VGSSRNVLTPFERAFLERLYHRGRAGPLKFAR